MQFKSPFCSLHANFASLVPARLMALYFLDFLATLLWPPKDEDGEFTRSSAVSNLFYPFALRY
jgi:hypothetical protein